MRRKHNSITSQLTKLVTVSAIALFLLFVTASALIGLNAPKAHAQSSPFPLNSVVASTTGLNLRSQPSLVGATVATMPLNAHATVMGGPFNDFWYWLNYDGAMGYASGKYLALVDDQYTPVPTTTHTAQGSSTVETSATATSAPAQSSPVSGTPAATPSEQTSATPQPSGSPQASPTSEITTPQVPGDYTGLGLGEMAIGGNLRSGPGLDKSVVKSWWAGRRVLLYQAALGSKGDTWYRVSEPPEAPLWVHSSLVRKVAPVKFETARFPGRWVNVNLIQQIVTAYEKGKPVMVTLASTGKAKHETTVGTWKIYWRLPKQTMEGGNLASGDYYKLKDVPYPQYFQISGEALHGTFWHDNFGRPMSHGCVNLSTPIASWFYGWANIGTVVYVHY